MNQREMKYSGIAECSCTKCKNCKIFTIEGELCNFCRVGNHAN